MRETRTSGSEGGEPGDRHSPTPIPEIRPAAAIASRLEKPGHRSAATGQIEHHGKRPIVDILVLEKN